MYGCVHGVKAERENKGENHVFCIDREERYTEDVNSIVNLLADQRHKCTGCRQPTSFHSKHTDGHRWMMCQISVLNSKTLR